LGNGTCGYGVIVIKFILIDAECTIRVFEKIKRYLVSKTYSEKIDFEGNTFNSLTK